MVRAFRRKTIAYYSVLVYYFELAFLSIMEDHMMAVQCKLILADKRNNTNERNYD